MDKFVAWSDAAGLVMSYYDATNMPEGKLAQQYTMDDNFFHAAFGGSFLNHFFLVCACAAQFPNAPDSIKAQLDANGSHDEGRAGDARRLRHQHLVHSQQPASDRQSTADEPRARTRRCPLSATA